MTNYQLPVTNYQLQGGKKCRI
ncbi:MAG: hypothetical protein AB1414_14460 [bacterium]